MDEEESVGYVQQGDRVMARTRPDVIYRVVKVYGHRCDVQAVETSWASAESDPHLRFTYRGVSQSAFFPVPPAVTFARRDSPTDHVR